MTKSDILAATWHLFLIVCILFVIGSLTAYRFRHPEMTETQLFIHVCEALRWAE